MIYCYYDKDGVLREIINDTNNRQNNNNVEIFVYIDRQDIYSVNVVYKIGNYKYPETVSQVLLSDRVETKVVPYNKNINYKWFKDNVNYEFYVFRVPTQITAHNGTCAASFYASGENFTEPLGLLTFNIQESIINSDEPITVSQFDYLLEQFSKYDFFVNNGILATQQPIYDGENVAPVFEKAKYVLYIGRNLEFYKIVDGKYQLAYTTETIEDFYDFLANNLMIAYIENDDTLVIENSYTMFTQDY